ncbi:hypothetical protein [Amycolatopsis sp. H20-H5]|uniref:hypothetical protein n=1 Tax=Amycolatopsis sp. H20-H5 TaxID=3046309 RepID=UPI002DBBC97D|nr:hypothetical protein [Amycolatopsis sp. H20-H5]MEC3977819.1 hypothetical protein [Amycolatopsis sp. H20-H5]
MDGPVPVVRAAMPGRVKAALVIVYFQVVANLVGAALAVAEVASRKEHHQEVTALAPFLIGESALLGLALLFCAVTLRSFRIRIRPALAVLEVIVVLGALYNIASGAALSGFGIALAVAAMVLLFNHRSTEWMSQ